MRVAGKQIPWWAVALLAVVVVAGVVVVATGGSGPKTAAPRSGAQQDQSGIASGSASVPSENGGQKDLTTQPAESLDDAGSGGSSDGDADGSSNPSGSVTKRGYVLVKFWNDAESNTPDGPLVMVGSSSWSPDAGARADAGRLSVVLGKTTQLLVYIDGKGGEKIAVPILVRPAMSAREPDAIHIEVRDDKVRVLGNPVVGFEVTSAR